MINLGAQLQQLVETELANFEWRDPDYTPSEAERALAGDFVNGLLSNEQFLRLAWAYYGDLIQRRLADGVCVDCGYPGPHHYVACGTRRRERQQHG